MVKLNHRHLIKLWYKLQGEASYSCEMNHAFDCGEFSSKFDGEIHNSYTKKFLDIIQKYGITIEMLISSLKDCEVNYKGPRTLEYHYSDKRKEFDSIDYQDMIMDIEMSVNYLTN